ncbi:MAG: hypothetical protein P1U61_04930 [Legionellaceae bacterium]|nr:hypothetical protein [Legionellaceae bacterium]
MYSHATTRALSDLSLVVLLEHTVLEQNVYLVSQYLIDLTHKKILGDLTTDAYQKKIMGTEDERMSLLTHPNMDVTMLYVRMLLEALRLKYLSQADIESFFEHRRANEYVFLGRLLYKKNPAHAFGAALYLLNEAYVEGFLSKAAYGRILVDKQIPGFSLLHLLVLRESEEPSESAINLENFKLYLHTIACLYRYNGLSETEYLYVFKQKNKCGFPTIHQIINAPDLSIAHYGLHFLFIKNDAVLSTDSRLELVRLKNKQVRGPQKDTVRSPRRSSNKLEASEMNQAVTVIRNRLMNEAHEKQVEKSLLGNSLFSKSSHKTDSIRYITEATSANFHA